jgi:predicted  nucleic acid-binding Zn-ribbon protein
MEVPEPVSVLEALAEVWRELEDELKGLEERKSGLERELEVVGKKIKSTYRKLDLVAITEDQLWAQGPGAGVDRG